MAKTALQLFFFITPTAMRGLCRWAGANRLSTLPIRVVDRDPKFGVAGQGGDVWRPAHS